MTEKLQEQREIYGKNEIETSRKFWYTEMKAPFNLNK